MTSMQRVWSVVLSCLWLVACGSADEPREPPPPVEETVFRDVAVTPIDKAKNVENVVMEQKRATDQSLDQANQ